MKAPLVRVVGMVFVAMILSLSLVVTTPTTAHALRVGPAVPPQVVGAVRTLAPAALTVASFTPPGFALRAVMTLGMLAFSTQDLWMPYVTGTFGNAEDQNTTSPAGGGLRAGFTVQSYSRNGNIITGTYNFTGGGSSAAWQAQFETVAKCQRDSDGYVAYARAGGWWSINTNNGDDAFTYTSPNMIPCPGGWTMKAWHVGGGGGARPQGYLPNVNGTQTTVQFSGSGSFAQGTQNFITGGDWASGFDPHGTDVKYKGRAECVDTAGNTSWIEAEESRGDAGGILMPSCAAQGKGNGTGRTQVIGFRPDGTTQTLWDIPTAPSDPSTPLCDPAKGSGCTLTVEIDGKGCEAGNVECENWSEVNQNDPNKNTSSSRVKCKLGPYTVPIGQCAMLEQAFLPGGAPATEENIDGDPATRNWFDPHGNPIPPAAPSITPIPGAVPGTGGSPGPGADDKTKACFPTGWSMLNPVEWVLKPVGCALESAFVPDPTKVQTRTATITNKMQNVGFQRITTAWLTTFESVGGGSGCAGPTINFDMNGVHQTLQPFNACSPPMSGVAAISYAVSSVVLVLFGGLGVARAIAAGFGFNFSMGRGGD